MEHEGKLYFPQKQPFNTWVFCLRVYSCVFVITLLFWIDFKLFLQNKSRTHLQWSMPCCVRELGFMRSFELSKSRLLCLGLMFVIFVVFGDHDVGVFFLFGLRFVLGFLIEMWVLFVVWFMYNAMNIGWSSVVWWSWSRGLFIVEFQVSFKVYWVFILDFDDRNVGGFLVVWCKV